MCVLCKSQPFWWLCSEVRVTQAPAQQQTKEAPEDLATRLFFEAPQKWPKGLVQVDDCFHTAPHFVEINQWRPANSPNVASKSDALWVPSFGAVYRFIPPSSVLFAGLVILAMADPLEEDPLLLRKDQPSTSLEHKSNKEKQVLLLVSGLGRKVCFDTGRAIEL